MDKKLIVIFIFPFVIFSNPYDERVAKLRVKADEAYLNKNWVTIIDVGYKLLDFDEKEELRKVLKLAEEIVIMKKSEAGALHICNLYKLIGDMNNSNKWNIIYQKIIKTRNKKWKKV